MRSSGSSVALSSSRVAHRRAAALWVVHTTYSRPPRRRQASASSRRLLRHEPARGGAPATASNAWKIDGVPSEATLFREIERAQPAVLLDEADALWGSGDVRTEPLRAIFNSGNRRGNTIPRCVGEGKNQEVHRFSVFSPKALLIRTSRWPDTVLDRAFLIQLRRARNEQVERLRFRKVGPEAKPLYEKVAAWSRANLEVLTGAEPEPPDELDDRAQDGRAAARDRRSRRPRMAAARARGAARATARARSTTTAGDPAACRHPHRIPR